MDRETAKVLIKSKLSDYLDIITTKGKNNKYICPLCGSGSGNNNNYTPALSATGEKWQCFSCRAGGDIFNLIAYQYNLNYIKDFREIFDIAAEVLSISIDKAGFAVASRKKNIPAPAQTMKTNEVEKEQKKIDYSGFLAACKSEVSKTDYFTKRGFTDETIDRFNLGLITQDIIDTFKTSCNLENYFFNGDVVIPYSRNGNYFIVRDTHTKPNAKSCQYPKWKKLKSENAGKEPVFNEIELDNDSKEPIFITEAPLDSISIIQAGGKSIAIGGTGIDKIKKALENRPNFSRSFIIAFDNPKQDIAGKTATEKLAEYLELKGISYTLFAFTDNVKDCNDYLMMNKGEFYKEVKKSITNLTDEQEKENNEYINENGAAALLEEYFINGLAERAKTRPTKTGFKELDSVLDGGLYEGLYCIGAISSLGKTTFTLQIADQIAKNGQDVLIFSLEMAKAELIAKSLSRLSLIACKNNGYSKEFARTARNITRGEWVINPTDTKIQVVDEAINKYRTYAPNIFIQEGIGDIGIMQIKETIDKHIAVRGRTPVVIIDYLQILAPYSDRASDKQNTDKAVLELKRISRDKKTPVIAISSFNRDNYSTAASMTAFKESGAIEYSSDVLIALQPQGMGDNGAGKETVDKCKASDIRELEAVVLKNRNGATGKKIAYNYYAKFNYYEETTKKEKETKQIKRI